MTGYICITAKRRQVLVGKPEGKIQIEEETVEYLHCVTFGSVSELSDAFKKYEKVLQKDEEILVCPDSED